VRFTQEARDSVMIPELRVCIAQAVWTVTSDLHFRIDRVRFIQLLLNELF
jgi:hypothetical protein